MSTRFVFFFFFNDTATTEIYTLSLHDALPISGASSDTLWAGVNLAGTQHRANPLRRDARLPRPGYSRPSQPILSTDRKSTRLNSSHANISYAVFCLKKKNADTHDNVCAAESAT